MAVTPFWTPSPEPSREGPELKAGLGDKARSCPPPPPKMRSPAWWCVSVIPAAWEAEARRIVNSKSTSAA